MKSSCRFRSTRVALTALASATVAGLLSCGGNSDPEMTTSSTTEALAATTRPSTQAVLPSSAALQLAAANHFDLDGGGLRISFDESAGVPVVTYQDALQTRTFRGAEVEIDATAAGTMVTVVTRMTIDSGSTTFSVLVPRVQVGAGSAPVETQGITTSHQFSIVRIDDPGQLDGYTFTPLHGSGSHYLAAFQTPATTLREGVVPPLFKPNN